MVEMTWNCLKEPQRSCWFNRIVKVTLKILKITSIKMVDLTYTLVLKVSFTIIVKIASIKLFVITILL